jgi:hypothetical protein
LSSRLKVNKYANLHLGKYVVMFSLCPKPPTRLEVRH